MMHNSIPPFIIVLGNDNEHVETWMRQNRYGATNPHSARRATHLIGALLAPMEPPPGDDEPGIGPPTEGDECPDEYRRPCTACHTPVVVPSARVDGLCLDCANAQYWGFQSRHTARQYASTLVSIEIEARIFVCTNCQGIHPTYRCPELWQTLRRDPDPTLGRDILRLRWVKHASFVALLVNAEPARLLHYAESYCAFIRTHTPASTLTARTVLERWKRLTDDAGPDAPAALQVAA